MKQPLIDPSTRYRIELLLILLVVTVLLNIGVYYLNQNYDKLNPGKTTTIPPAVLSTTPAFTFDK